MNELFIKLEEIQRNGLAVEESDKQELIEFIAEIKQQINELIKDVSDKVDKLESFQKNILENDLYDEGYYNGIELALNGNNAKFRWNTRNNIKK